MVLYIVKLLVIILAALPFYLLLRRPWRRIPGNDSPVEKDFPIIKKAAGAGKLTVIKPAREIAMERENAMARELAMAREIAIARELAIGCFVLFTVGLLALALEGEYGTPARMFARTAQRLVTGEGINMIPFRTIVGFLKHFSMDIFAVNIIGNIVMFMPWGFGLVLLWKAKQNIWKILLYSLLITLFIEASQLFIGRSVDVDDLILNFAGSCLGAGIYFLLRKKFPQIVKLAR